jgi:hypothetical protein
MRGDAGNATMIERESGAQRDLANCRRAHGERDALRTARHREEARQRLDDARPHKL